MANDSTERYFNAPIQLYDGFMVDSSSSLSNVSKYACYEYSLKNKCSFKEAIGYFNISYGKNTQSDLANPLAIGKQLYEQAPCNSPKVGIGLKLFWQYFKQDKSDFEKACLLAFLALKSIIQNKPYCKIDNRFILSRMDGKAKSIEDIFLLSIEVRKFGNEYQLAKIKNELVLNWGLKHYSRYTRGFYVSFSLQLEDLIFEAEKRRKSTKDKLQKEAEKKALAKALKRLNGSTTNTRP
ncbi:hypothetical protein [Parasediminibacterium sp. JCM 36343]|uniref:hypothetical protein n=1 Tax=Parasediminibacterium sp. JCM 36343 TaxID=3374279 RepID=UPI00397D9321